MKNAVTSIFAKIELVTYSESPKKMLYFVFTHVSKFHQELRKSGSKNAATRVTLNNFLANNAVCKDTAIFSFVLCKIYYSTTQP